MQSLHVKTPKMMTVVRVKKKNNCLCNCGLNNFMDIILMGGELFLSIAGLGNSYIHSNLKVTEYSFVENVNATNVTNYVNSTDDITSRFEVESISNRFFILDIIVEIIEWAGVGLLLIAFLIVLFESLVFLKVVYKQRKVSYIQKRNMYEEL